MNLTVNDTGTNLNNLFQDSILMLITNRAEAESLFSQKTYTIGINHLIRGKEEKAL